MMRRMLFVALAAGAAGALTVPAPAQMAPPKLPGQPTPEEAKFVDEASRYVSRRYPTTADAKAAGFIEFTPEDSTGAISWANRHWSSTDYAHPSQVWYDAGGRLIGADYSVLREDSPQAPHLWGIDPRRWIKIGTHVHFGVHQPDGTITLGGVGGKRFTDAGGSLAAPTKQMIVNLGVVRSPGDVAFVFLFPAIWDLQIWVIPNPDGAFAEKNPNVKPRNAQPHPA